MLSNIPKYRILAFVVAHKLRRRNSCIYQHEKKYHVAQEMDISPTTYSKYLRICREQGYAYQKGRAVQFRKLSEVVKGLFGEDTRHYWKHTRFFTGIQYQDLKYKTILRQIEFAVADCNFKRQEYRNNNIVEVLNSLQNRFSTRKQLNAAKKVAKHFGCSIVDLPRICKNVDLYIKTGKHHLSNLLRCSPSTAKNRLKSWAVFWFHQKGGG